MPKRRQKRVLDLDINTAGAVHSKTIDLDKSIVKILGLVFTSDRDDLMYYRGTQRVEINREEIFEENYETKLLQALGGIAPNDKYYELEEGIDPGNYKLKVDYTDNNHALFAFAPYRITLNLDVQIADTP